MTLEVLCFFQPGCMGCMEQQPINAEIRNSLSIAIDEIDVIKSPRYIGQYHLKATPTIIVLSDGQEKERFEGVVFAEQLETVLKKYL